MTGQSSVSGWLWGIDAPGQKRGAPHGEAGSIDIAALAARCFKGTDGDRLLAYLRNLCINRALGPEAGDAQLRHLEGQRQLVVHLTSLIERGRHGASSNP